jgi:hypothetical protein
MRVSRAIVVGLLISVASSSPASALFGSECKKPKSSFSEQLALSKKLQKGAYDFTPQEKATFYLEQRKKKKRDLSNCLERNLLTTEECNAITNLPPESGLVRTEILAQSRKALDTAYRIVLNNQKCFDPIIVVEAQRFRGK